MKLPIAGSFLFAVIFIFDIYIIIMTKQKKFNHNGLDIMDETIYGDIYSVDTSGTTIYCG